MPAHLAGYDRLALHFPDLRTRAGLARLAARGAGWFGLTLLFFALTDRFIPEWQPDGQILVTALGFLVLARFFNRKTAFQARHGELAYRHAFVRAALPGLAIIFAVLAHCAYLPGLPIPALWWRDLLRLLGLYLTLVGAGLWARAALTFGLDNLAMLYVYYPQDSRLIDSSIYGLLRHPVYAGALRVMLGLCLLNGTWQALAYALLAPLGYFGWIRLVEEPDLLGRFPDYAVYRRRVPAFWTWRIGRLWRFLLSGR